MALLAVPSLVFTFATFVLAMLWRLGLALFRRPAPGFFRHVLVWHAGLFSLHFFLVVPLLLGFVVARSIGTRPDERGYDGPRLAADGTWLLQTRASLAAERPEGAAPEVVSTETTARHAVKLTARDGVPLRAFLVPPPAHLAEDGPRFAAVLVHGFARGALEIETPGAMFRELGGEVLLLEMRNHGGSGRAQATLGPDEALDVLAAVEFFRNREEAGQKPLVLYGVSGGSSAVALASPQIPDLAGIVLDAPIDDLEAAALRELGRGGLAFSVPRPWSSIVLWSTEHLGGVPISTVKPANALAGLSPNVAVLLIGAGQDERMPPDSVREMFQGLPTLPNLKDIWIEPEARHGKVWVAAPDEYRRRLARFCEAIQGDAQDDHPVGLAGRDHGGSGRNED
jgi:hypothetical protein